MNQPAAQALVELLFLTIYLDDRLSMPENEVLGKALAALGWREGNDGSVDVGAAYRVAKEAASCELRAEDFLRQRTALLKADGHSLAAFEWLGRMLGSDGLDPGEKRFLERIQGMLFD